MELCKSLLLAFLLSATSPLLCLIVVLLGFNDAFANEISRCSGSSEKSNTLGSFIDTIGAFVL